MTDRLFKFVAVTAIIFCVTAAAKPPKQKPANPGTPPLPIRCFPAATAGESWTRTDQNTGESDLYMPYMLNCSFGNSNGCTYSRHFQLFQWLLVRGAWQYALVDDECNNLYLDCGVTSQQTYTLQNVDHYGHGNFFAALTTYQGSCAFPGNPMSVEWYYFNQ